MPSVLRKQVTMKRQVLDLGITGVMLIVLILMAGCASHQVMGPVIEDDPQMEIKMADFPLSLIVPDDFKVTDRKDPEQLIKKGIEQSEKGRHGYAAEFFIMAASTPSPENRLKTSALFAAANEYLRIGKLHAFIQVMTEINENLDKFARVSLSDQEATLMAFYELTQGGAYRSGLHPEATREIFEQPREE